MAFKLKPKRKQDNAIDLSSLVSLFYGLFGNVFKAKNYLRKSIH